jgi:hypothetical protein
MLAESSHRALNTADDDPAALLEQAHVMLQVAQDLIQLAMRELSARAPDPASHLFPLACKHISVQVHHTPLIPQ